MKKILLLLALLFCVRANSQEVYAVADHTIVNGVLTLYAPQGRCPSGTSEAVLRHDRGMIFQGCWMNGSEEYMIKFYDEWNRSMLFKVKDFKKDPYFVKLEAERMKKKVK